MKLILKIVGHSHFRRFIVLLATDALVFGGTSAKSVPSLMLIIGFVLLLATIYQLVSGLLLALGLYGVRLPRQQRLALYLTLFSGVAIALQTIGELSPRDVLVLLPLAGLAYLYSSYGRQAV